MDEEEFERGLESWKALVSTEFPIYEPLQNWRLNIKEKNGVPYIDPNEKGKLEITPRFSKKSSAEGFDWSIRCAAGQFTMNMHSGFETSTERRYPKLRSEFSRWLPQWMQHFKVGRPTHVDMTYLNVLNHETVKPFYSEGALNLAQVINLFSRIPGEFKSIIPPYACEVNLQLHEREDASLGVKMTDCPQKDGHPAVRVDLMCRAPIQRGIEETPDKILDLMNWCHERMIVQFEKTFTQEAKAHFEPIRS